MTAQWVGDAEAPIGYALTDAGWAATRTPNAGGTQPRVPAEPLLRQIELHGGDAACGVRPGTPDQKALERARRDGTLTLWAADRLAVRLLGLTLWELTG